MASTIKVNNIQNQCGANIVNKCSTTITLGASGDNITLACGATQSGFGRTGTVDWDTTAKTTNFTAVSGTGYFVNTTSGAITVTLPAGSAGDIVSLADYAATWQTNNVTVTPNGTDKIGGENVSVTLNTEGQSVTFVYTDSTQGWINTMDSTSNVRGNAFIIATGGTVTTCGDYKIHTFTGPGTFTVTCAGIPANANVDYLVVAGGGSGGADEGGGGGGAGGFRESSGAASGCYTTSPLGACVSALPVSITAYPITVGAGGATSTHPTACRGNAGSNSVFSTITSTGGGGGGMSDNIPTRPGGDGGSGGGGGEIRSGVVGSGGSGNTPPVAPPQGNNGGPGSPVAANAAGAGGGGGASATGGTGKPAGGGDGAAGVTTNISASPVSYAGGGGGGVFGPGTLGAGGLGGGGDGARRCGGPIVAEAGTANTGGGGGGGADSQGLTTSDGAAGGSGIVIIRYKYQ